MMAVIDKLHKIYSSTSEPLVWARSVGIEVLNEIDTVKTAMISAAGANSATGEGQGWTQVAVGIENLTRGLNTAKLVSDGVVGGLGTRLQRVLNSVSQQVSKTAQTKI